MRVLVEIDGKSRNEEFNKRGKLFDSGLNQTKNIGDGAPAT